MRDHPAAKGLAALRQGDPAAALVHFEALVAAEPGGVPGHFLRAEAVDRLGDRARARSLLQELITRFPFAEAACRERLALLSLREGDRAGALAELTRAVDLGWNNPAVLGEEPAFAQHASDPEFLRLMERASRNEA